MKPHSSEFLKKEFSAGCQPRYPVKIPITTWKSLSPPRGLQLSPSCQARCPVKTSNEMENYPAPSAAQLLTMLLHREHFCSYLYYTQFNKKINLFLICKISIIFNLSFWWTTHCLKPMGFLLPRPRNLLSPQALIRAVPALYCYFLCYLS